MTQDGNGMTGLESLVFASLLSATDPVTVLAIFGKMGADRDLYALVFGESVLNDAVAIVLYKSFSRFNPHTCGTHGFEQCAAGFEAFVIAFVTFCKIFAGSVFVGCLIAAAASLTFKHMNLTHAEFFPVENVFLVVFPYMAWMLAESLEFSGIVAILFCGFGMDVYTFINLSEDTRNTIKKMIKVIAFGCETFVFVYMGMSLFLYKQTSYTVPAIIVSILAMAATRVLNVYPICAITNAVRPARRAIKPATQHVTWYSGLRGGIAFALAMQAAGEFTCRVPSCRFTMVGAELTPVHFRPHHVPTAKDWFAAKRPPQYNEMQQLVYTAEGLDKMWNAKGRPSSMATIPPTWAPALEQSLLKHNCMQLMCSKVGLNTDEEHCTADSLELKTKKLHSLEDLIFNVTGENPPSGGEPHMYDTTGHFDLVKACGCASKSTLLLCFLHSFSVCCLFE